MAPRTTITRPNQRPLDTDFAYFVVFYDATKRGTWALWTDNRDHAEQFARVRHVYAKPSVVKTRAEWAIGRSINFTEPQGSHVTIVQVSS